MSSSTLTLQLKPNPVFESIISDGTSQSGITILVRGDNNSETVILQLSIPAVSFLQIPPTHVMLY